MPAYPAYPVASVDGTGVGPRENTGTGPTDRTGMVIFFHTP
jgi:hypothetical protein